MGGGGGVEGIGGGAGQRRADPHRAQGQGSPAAQAGRDHEDGGGGQAHDEDGGAKPRHPLRGAVEQEVPPQRGGRQCRAEPEAGPELCSPLPQCRGADADHGTDGRGRGDRVVGMDDPLSQADHEHRHDQPSGPQQHAGAGAVGAGLSAP